MFWTRNSAASTVPTGTTGGSSSSSTFPSMQSRPSGFFAALDLRGASDDNGNLANQSAGENAREVVIASSQSGNDGDKNNNSEDDRGALPNSFILSEKRRNELLHAARASRSSWINGANDPNTTNDSSATTTKQWNATSANTVSVPLHCQEAIEQIGLEMQALLSKLAQLKDQIIPNDAVTMGSMGDDDNEDNQSSHDIVTIADELRERHAELESWKRVHITESGGLSAMQRKRMTASDKEMLFLLAFQELLMLLKHPLAAEIVYQIQVFVKKFEHWNLEAMLRHRGFQDRPGGHVQGFIDKLVQQLQHHSASGASLFEAVALEILCLHDDEDQFFHEVLEAFLMEKLYIKALTPSLKAEKEDDLLRDRLESLSFVEFRHLDLPVPVSLQVEKQWQSLAAQLGEIASFPSPRRKMDCVLRVCQQVTTLLSSLHEKRKFPSADEFLPALIYLLLKANPKQLKRNVHLILEYRRPSRLVSEPGYFFTHLVSSVAFLEQVNGDLLTITPEEFENGLKKHTTIKSAQGLAMAMVVDTMDKETERSDQKQLKEEEVNGTPMVQELRLPTVLDVRARRLAAMH